jgi:hypothetical protein
LGEPQHTMFRLRTRRADAGHGIGYNLLINPTDLATNVPSD